MKISTKKLFYYIGGLASLLTIISFLKSYISIIFKKFIAILVHQITLPLWTIILLILCLISLIIYVSIILYKKYKNKKPDWYNYKEDKIFDIYWEWIWLYDRVYDLFPRCPKCSTKVQLN